MRKGFTLIELLAVIVILAIIAIIAVPTISNVVSKARKGATEASALNYIDAVEKYMILHDMNPTKYPYDIKGGTFNVASNTEVSLLDLIIPKAKAEETIPSLNSFINVKGDKPKSGTITTNEKGKVTEADIVIKGYSIECTGSSCEAHGGSSSNSPSTPKLTYISPESGETHKGVVYLDPTDLTKVCTLEMVNENINNYDRITGIKDGCMKWYIFSETTDKYKMILDHNINKEGVAFNDDSGSKNYTVDGSLLKPVLDDLVKVDKWKVSARIITLDEIAEITGIPNVINGWTFFGSKNGTDYASSSSQEQAEQRKYYWLFDNMKDCVSNGCKVNDNAAYNVNTGGSSYITYTAEQYWIDGYSQTLYLKIGYVSTRGFVGAQQSDFGAGIRPVIEVDKSLFE